MMIQTLIKIAVCLSVVHNVNSIFPQINKDLTKIRWAHAVNSKNDLQQALNDVNIDMLEADVVMGRLIRDVKAPDIPIMAHPPNNRSDLSLEEFIETVVQDRKKGFKLDFKETRVLIASGVILNKFIDNISVPLFLNADIITGPVNASAPTVDANKFLQFTEKFNQCILSLGWTTRYGSGVNITEGSYSSTQLNKMIKKVENMDKMLTFPIRAGLAAETNLPVWIDFIDKTSNDSTITIWHHHDDNVNLQKLSMLISAIGIDRVYLDLPPNMLDQVFIGLPTSRDKSVVANLKDGRALIN